MKRWLLSGLVPLPHWKLGTSLRTASWIPWSLSPLHSSSPPLSSSREEQLVFRRWWGNCGSHTLTHAHTPTHTLTHTVEPEHTPVCQVPQKKVKDNNKKKIMKVGLSSHRLKKLRNNLRFIDVYWPHSSCSYYYRGHIFYHLAMHGHP